AQYLKVRSILLMGRLNLADQTLSKLDPSPFPAALRTGHELIAAGIAIRRLQTRAARAALSRAASAAQRACIPALTAEVENAYFALSTGRVLATIPAPGGGGDSGLAWAEGALWVGQYRARKIHQIDPETGKILRTIDSNRFVTGVTWVDGELWQPPGK